MLNLVTYLSKEGTSQQTGDHYPYMVKIGTIPGVSPYVSIQSELVQSWCGLLFYYP